MRYISVNSLKENMKIAKTIYTSTGKIVLPAGTKLTNEIIDKIKRAGISYLWIEDSRVSDVKIQEIITYGTRFGILYLLRTMYKNLEEVKNISSRLPILEEVIEIKKLIEYAEDILEEVDRIEDLKDFSHDKEITLSQVDNLDDYFPVHSLNTALLSFVIGKFLKFDRRTLIDLLISGFLHDIGIIWIPENILKKRGKLTDSEYQLVKEHPEYSYKIIQKNVNINRRIINAVYQHHELLNGSGYPKHLKKEEISQLAKIITICDVYSSLISKRPWREAFLPHQAIEYILGNGGEMFDYELVEIFARLIPSYPKGIMVRLNTGEIGCVVNPNKGIVARPVVRIFYDKDGKEVKNLYEYDLAEKEHQTKIITDIVDM